MFKRMNDKVVDRFGQQGVILFAWGVVCLGFGLAIDAMQPWTNESGVFFTTLDLRVREALWLITAAVAMIASVCNNRIMRGIAFSLLALTFAQRATGYIMASVTYVVPGPPESTPTSIGGAIAYIGLIWVVWLTALWSPPAGEEKHGA